MAGAGPAGIACALRLRRRGHRGPVLVVDKARFPRPKVCCGGLTGRVAEALAALGLALRVPAVAVAKGEVRFGRFRREVTLRRPVQIVRREELDADLLEQARAAGVEVREGEALTGFATARGGVEVRTEADTYQARVLIGADGAGSLVRRRLVEHAPPPLRLLHAVAAAPAGAGAGDGADDRIVFDFTPMRQGVRGYVWTFPSPGGRVSAGLLHHGGERGLDLQAILRGVLAARGLEVVEPPSAWPVWGYDQAQRAAIPHVLLCGDALGVNPLSGEGISPSLWQGILAADTVLEGFGHGDLGFGGYAHAVRRATVGRELNLDRRLAGMLYGGAGLSRWLPLMLFDDEMAELYAARVAGVTVLADEKPRLLKALVRHRFMLPRWRRRLEREA